MRTSSEQSGAESAVCLPHVVASVVFKDLAMAIAAQHEAVQLELIMARLRQPDCCRGFVLDNYPRTPAQARAFDASLLEVKGWKITHVLDLEVPVRILEQRAAGRLVDRTGMPVLEARVDDAPTVHDSPEVQGQLWTAEPRLSERRSGDAPDRVQAGAEDADGTEEATVHGSPEVQEQLRTADPGLLERRSDDAPERFQASVEDADGIVEATVHGSPEVQEQLRTAEPRLLERRSDDAPERFQARFHRFTGEIAALREHYGSDRCKSVDGSVAVEAVQEAALRLLGVLREPEVPRPPVTRQQGDECPLVLGLLDQVRRSNFELAGRLLAVESDLRREGSWATSTSREPCGCETVTKRYGGLQVPRPGDTSGMLGQCQEALRRARMRHAEEQLDRHSGELMYILFCSVPLYASCCPGPSEIEQLDGRLRGVRKEAEALRSRCARLDSMTATQTRKTLCSEHRVPTPVGSP